MKRLAIHLIAAALPCLTMSRAEAQDARLKAGAVVRFGVPPRDSLYVGTLARVTPDSLVLLRCSACNRLGYARAEVNHLAVASPYNRGDRTLAGLGLGALIGGSLGYLSAASCHGGDQCDLAALAVPFGGIAGAILGAAVGFMTAYRWMPVSD